MISLPEPLIEVEFEDANDHVYRARRRVNGGNEYLPSLAVAADVSEGPAGDVQPTPTVSSSWSKYLVLPGVTGTLGIIAKPALIGWARKEALASVERAFATRLEGMADGRIDLSMAWVKNVIKEAQKQPDRIKDSAADVGTRAHAAFNDIAMGKEPTLTPDIERPVAEYRKWRERSGIRFIAGETKVASLLYGYAGSLDEVGHDGERFVIVDYKTSKGIYDEYALQVAAYWQAFHETYGIKATRGVIVRFGKDGSFETKEIKDLTDSFTAFLHAFNLKQSLAKEHYA